MGAVEANKEDHQTLVRQPMAAARKTWPWASLAVERGAKNLNHPIFHALHPAAALPKVVPKVAPEVNARS